MKSLFDRKIAEKGLFLSQICVLVSIPHLYYLYFVGMKDIVLKHFKAEQLPYLMTIQVWQVFIVTFCCGLCGFAWSERFNLVGFGKWSELKKSWMQLTAIGILIGVISIIFVDKDFKNVAHYYYPSNPLWALSVLLNSAVFIETVRFGMIMIVIRLTRHIHIANIIIAFFLTIVGIKSFVFITVTSTTMTIVLCLFWTMLFNLIQGYIFIKKGLLCAMFVQGIYGLKYLYFTLVSY